MSGSLPRIYWDANCCIAYFQKEPAHFATVETLLHEANVAKTIQIVTSVLSIMEVTFTEMERKSGVLSAAEQAILDRFWSGSGGILLVDFNESVGRHARDIRCDDFTSHSIKTKKTADLIHIATARYMGVDQVHSTDPHVLRYHGRYGLSVTPPFTAKMRLPGI
jgi:predicted nucleic acid-binding protein